MDEPLVDTRLRQAVAEEVRALLARRRISGVQLAARIGRSQAYISRRLTGDTAFDVDDLEGIARTLGVSVIDLMPRSGGDAGQAPAAGNTLRNCRGTERTNPIVSTPVKDRPTGATSRPPRGPRKASTAPAPRRPALLPRPTAA